MIETPPLSTAPAILSLGTAVPRYASRQSDIGDWMAASFKEQPALQRLIRSIHAYSGIEMRHSCTPEYLIPVENSPFAPGHVVEQTITTGERMAIYEREAPKLGVTAARRALEALKVDENQSVSAVIDSITHLIVVSCTGFFAPGLDFVMAGQLGLSTMVKRSLIGFMGCSAAFNALRTAHEIVAGAPSARVLVVCVELCSLHGQPGSDRDLLVAASLFSDGAAAAIIGTPRSCDNTYFALDGFHTSMKPNTQDEMVWRIGDHGFELRLSPRIPEHLAEVAPVALETLFACQQPSFWAIHPGGRAIVDRLAEIFSLADSATQASYEVLRRFGNMSSATILFVLKELQEHLAAGAKAGASPERDRPPVRSDGVAMAFGPGLVIEMARLTYVSAPLAPPYRNTHRVREDSVGDGAQPR